MLVCEKVNEQNSFMANWDSFDLAVGISRANLVEYALDNASNLEIRLLLMPEIKEAVLAELYKSRSSRTISRAKQQKQDTFSRIDELLTILRALDADADLTDEGKSIQAEVDRLVNESEILEKIESSNADHTIEIPKELCTPEFYQMGFAYLDALENNELKDALAECSLATGHQKVLSIEELDTKFENISFREKYRLEYDKYVAIRARILGGSEKIFKQYCQNQEIYTAYVIGHYLVNKPFIFKKEYFFKQMTSMVDVTAAMLQVKIFVHYKSNQNIVYATKANSDVELHINWTEDGIFSKHRENKRNDDFADISLKSIATEKRTSSLERRFVPQFQHVVQAEHKLFDINQAKTSAMLNLEKELKTAYDTKDYYKQCLKMSALGALYLEQKKYSSAAKLLMGAYALFCRYLHHHDQETAEIKELRILLVDKLRTIEPTFIKDKFRIISDPELKNTDNIIHRQYLNDIRDECDKRLLGLSKLLIGKDTLAEYQGVFEWIVAETNFLLQGMISDCIDIIGPPPCDYAFVGTGSLARMEMTPYSDLEYFILISDSSQKDYFRALSQLLELKIILLGETDLVKGQTLLPEGMLNPTRKGFSLDVHKNASNTEFELIGTPFEMAQFQLPEHYVEEPTNHLSGALLNTIFIDGNNQSLLFEYQQNVSKIYEQIVLETGETLRVSRALKILGGDAEHFQPKHLPKHEGAIFQVKEDLYRLPQTIMDALALHQDLQTSSTLERIEELYRRKFILEEGKDRLKFVFAMTTCWRLSTYCRCGAQEEVLDFLSQGTMNKEPPRQNQYGITEKNLQDMQVALETFMALHTCAIEFFQTNGKRNLFKEPLLSSIPLMNSALAAARLGRYHDVVEICKRALKSTNKASFDDVALESAFNICYILLGQAYKKIGNLQKSEKYYLKSIDFLVKRPNIDNQKNILANAHNNLGLLYQEMAEPCCGGDPNYLDRAKHHLEVSLELCINNEALKATLFLNLGLLYRLKGEHQRSICYYKDSLKILKHSPKLYQQEIILVAANYNGLGMAHQSLFDCQKAYKYFEEALAIFVKSYGEHHPSVAKIYNGLGLTSFLDNDPLQAKVYHEKALAIETAFFGWKHKEVSITVQHLNNTYTKLIHFNMMGNRLIDPVECFKNALHNNTEAFGENHPYVLKVLNDFAVYRYQSGQAEKSLKLLNKLLSLTLTSHKGDEKHFDVACVYDKLGDACFALTQYENALRHYSHAQKICVALFGTCNQHVTYLNAKISQVQMLSQQQQYHMSGYSGQRFW